MKPVLIVAYHYPPSVAVGAVRPSKIARYLPDVGWRPIVLTATAADQEDARAAVDVHRVAAWTHPLSWYEERSRRRIERAGRHDLLTATWNASYDAVMAKPRGWKGLILPFLRVPDQELGWLAPAVARGLRLIRRNRIRAMITTGPPFTTHLVGLWLKRLTGIGWLADFRDPWLLSHKYPLHRNRGSDWVEGRLIDQVMRRADRVVSVTPAMTEQLCKASPQLPASKFMTITGGFDPEEFERIEYTRPAIGPIRFSYLGTFYHGRSPEPFLRAVHELIRDGRLAVEDIRVAFIGNVRIAEGRPVAEMIERYHLQAVVTVAEMVPRAEALKATLESDVVLVLDERHPVQVPYKLYEGLAAGAAIFNIGSEGAVADLVTKTGRGIAVSHRSPDAIAQGIVECIRRARQQRERSAVRPWDAAAIAPFHFRAITAQVATALEEATKEAACPAA
ncbi:MAG TPA: hypothetical protein VFA38_01730 [Nitrospirales bacterium]|nr:hypothetical protein [Nitrospirales bacterium]